MKSNIARDVHLAELAFAGRIDHMAVSQRFRVCRPASDTDG